MSFLYKSVVTSLLFSTCFVSSAFAECPVANKAVARGEYGQALSYYEMCLANTPDSEDYYKLASLYYKSMGLTAADYILAEKFYSLAAKRGHAPSMLFLGLMALNGNNRDSVDKVDAYKWFMLASERPENKWIYGFYTADTPKSVEYLRQVGATLSDEEKEKASVLAGRYKEEIIMQQAERIYGADTPELKDFRDGYYASDEMRERVLGELKLRMQSEPEDTDRYKPVGW